MSAREAIEAVALEVQKLRAYEVGGCFNDDEDTYGECADGDDCYCARQCKKEALNIATAFLRALHKAGPSEAEIEAAIRAGCDAADVHMACTYPNCCCRHMPSAVRAAIAAHLSSLIADIEKEKQDG